MKTLLIDAGNSSIKWAILKNGFVSSQRKQFYGQDVPIKTFQKVILENKSCDTIIIVSVLDESFTQQAEAIIKGYSILFHFVHSTKKLAGITNGYFEPQTLGTDRMVAMVAAFYFTNNRSDKKQACLVVDAGTATTIDAINKNGQHLGGLILPGSDLCSHSLLNNTALLSKRNTGKIFTPNLFPKDTSQAISSASILGLASAIENICLKMEEEFSEPVQRILCGGNATILLPFMESSYDYQENLIMYGLKIVAETSNWISNK